MWLKNKLRLTLSVLVIILPTLTYGEKKLDFVDEQRALKKLEINNKKAELRGKNRAINNAIPGNEQRFRRKLNVMELEIKQQELINKRQQLLNELSALQPQLPLGQMFLWDVSGVDGELSGTIVQIRQLENTEQAISGVAPLESFKAKEGDTLPNGWTVTKINLDGAELTRQDKTIRVGLLYSNIVL